MFKNKLNNQAVIFSVNDKSDKKHFKSNDIYLDMSKLLFAIWCWMSDCSLGWLDPE